MEELKKLLAQTDEEYLIGLSNKGTVKRAYKDLEQESPSVVWEGEEAEVALKEAVCRIRVPLGDSTCSCPSRSVCRHLITAVLYLKKELEKGVPSQEKEAETEAEQEAEAGAKAEKQSPGALLPELEQELLSIPAGRLRQACKTRGYREFLLHMDQGELPKLEPGASGSLLTVRFPWNQMVVKLLSPLEHSTCSCHSRELCVHKAQAVLAFQLQKGTLTRKQLEDGRKEAGEWDLEELSQAAGAMKAGLSLQLLTGLSRLSPEAEESMERLAVISHGAGLPDFETVFRSAASEYRQYFQRSGAFRTESLLARLLGLYARAVALEQMKEPEKLRALAGTFRDTYAPVPRLHLTAIGGRSFQSKTGYAGERYYFLETEQKRWYTWTDVRPVFYEGIRRRPAGNYEQEQAPWGMNCSRADMMELEFYLDQAKAAEDGRLSVSRETKSEIAGQRNLAREEIREMVVWDYRELLPMLEGQERRFRKAEGREPLVLAGAVRCGEGRFDSVKQRFAMDIYDRYGRRISVAVNYSKEEKLTIQALERLSARLAGQQGKEQKEKGWQEKARTLVFFGIPYLEGGSLCLYPIEYFEGKRFGAVPEISDQEGTPRVQEKENLPAEGTVKALEQLLLEMRQTLGDLFQSGLDSVQEESMSQLRRLEKESEEMGLHGGSEELSRIRTALEQKAHQMEFDPEPVILAWGRLMEYLGACLEKTSFDQALIRMEDT